MFPQRAASTTSYEQVEIIELVAQKADISKNKAGEAIDAFIKAIGESLAKGEDVSILGFGTFSVSERGSRMGRHPAPANRWKSPPASSRSSRPARGLKDMVK